MGLDTELEFEKYIRVGWNPKIGRPSHRHDLEVEERDARGKPMSSSYLSSSLDEEDFTEISFGKFLNSSRKSLPSGPAGLEDNEKLKRGSIYQSSKAVRKMNKLGAAEGRRKIELSGSNDTSFSFWSSDSSQSNEDGPLMQQKRSSVMYLGTEPNTTSASKPYIESSSQDFLELSFRLPPSPDYLRAGYVSPDRLFDICLDSENRDNHSAETTVRGSMEDLSFRCYQTISPLNDGNDLLERDTVLTLRKSSSAKVGMPYLACQTESNDSKARPKPRFSPIRRLLHPITKSKSQRSPSVSVAEPSEVTTNGSASISRNWTVCQSLLRDFSNTMQNTESGAHFVKKDNRSSIVASSPAHLHGLLKLEYKHGVPLFEFSLDPEDVLVAKTWKADNAFNWVYTFHSMNSRMPSNSNGWGGRERHRESSMVGQMQVSCYLCSEMNNGGAFDNSMVTEFVLYDIAHARKSFDAQGSSHWSPNSIEPPDGTTGEGLIPVPTFESNDVSSPVKRKFQPRHASGNGNSNISAPYPWAPADLHPNLEIAAIVIQVPFDKWETLKDKQGGKLSDKANSNLSDFSTVEQRSDNVLGSISSANMKVVTSTGTHGLPSIEEGGSTSSLLDRWRSGGGCDCGGWDMTCPLVVFGSPIVQHVGDNPLMEDQWPFELFVQGSKEKIPALTITVIDGGQYSVDFHARLSKLQAFSICVAILRSVEVSTAVKQERNRQRLQSNTLKMLLEEEVKFLIEAVTEEEKRKVTKKMEEIPSSFIINPPFSPMARV
ncbi:hypothetical protein HHK36_027727 [Tetracentron sinense]|uniref:Uncharacterized protein n=1 Tax=Tetracentron sinense TaxID=13715 RepID=A0A834YIA3_TETSI|nr:hypothetical protein HHK36_027727 [Tetracentron sinense]